MGWIRFLHFAAAAVLVATAIIRVYWLFAGNKYERWVALFPVRRRDWVNLVKQVKFYLMIHPEKAPALPGTQSAPAVQLYRDLPGWRCCRSSPGSRSTGSPILVGSSIGAFGWIGPLLGGMPVVRFVHHVVNLGVPHLHPDPCVSGHSSRPPGAGRHHLLHHQRRPVRAFKAALCR